VLLKLQVHRETVKQRHLNRSCLGSVRVTNLAGDRKRETCGPTFAKKEQNACGLPGDTDTENTAGAARFGMHFEMQVRPAERRSRHRVRRRYPTIWPASERGASRFFSPFAYDTARDALCRYCRCAHRQIVVEMDVLVPSSRLSRGDRAMQPAFTDVFVQNSDLPLSACGRTPAVFSTPHHVRLFFALMRARPGPSLAESVDVGPPPLPATGKMIVRATTPSRFAPSAEPAKTAARTGRRRTTPSGPDVCDPGATHPVRFSGASKVGTLQRFV